MRRRGAVSLATAALATAIACGDAGRVDAATLERSGEGPRIRVAILAAPNDPRVATVREAVGHWNGELARLGRRLRLDSATVVDAHIPDADLAAASGEAMFGRGPATSRLRARLAAVPADVVIALSDTALISFGLPWHPGTAGVVVIRRADVPPLSLPNTLRNVVAHELGHALGLAHDGDAASLMCGRPAPCRPAAFASERAHFFPLTPDDDRRLRARWP